MNSSLKTRAGLLLTLPLFWACSSDPAAPSGPAASAGSAGQSSGASGGSGGVGASGGGSGLTGGMPSGGDGGSVSAGSSGTGTTAGSGGTGGSGVTDLYACVPTGEGDGTHEQPEPYGRPPEAFPVDGVAAGTITELAPFASTVYGREFAHRVYVPVGYDPSVPVPLMVVPDGCGHYFGASDDYYTDANYYIQHVLDNLIAAGEMPPTIALLIDVCMTGCEDQRQAVFDFPDDKFATFISDEIIPDVILANYSVIQDRDAWTMVGYSGGGMQAFAVSWYRPELFGKVIIHNGSFPAGKANGTDFEALIPAGPAQDLRISMVTSTNDIIDDRGNWFDSSTAIAAALTAKGATVRLMTGTGGHYPPEQSAADFPNAMRWMYQGCPGL